MGYGNCGRAFLVECICLLGEPWWDHCINAGSQWCQGGFGQLSRQLDLYWREHCLLVKQGYHRFGFGHLRLFDEAEDHPLHLLVAKWDFHQVTRLHHPLQLRRQVVVKGPAHLRDVDCDFYIGGHLLWGSIIQPYQA